MSEIGFGTIHAVPHLGNFDRNGIAVYIAGRKEEHDDDNDDDERRRKTKETKVKTKNTKIKIKQTKIKRAISIEPRQANLCLRAFRHDKF